jgi:hypothetical protein
MGTRKSFTFLINRVEKLDITSQYLCQFNLYREEEEEGQMKNLSLHACSSHPFGQSTGACFLCILDKCLPFVLKFLYVTLMYYKSNYKVYELGVGKQELIEIFEWQFLVQLHPSHSLFSFTVYSLVYQSLT